VSKHIQNFLKEKGYVIFDVVHSRQTIIGFEIDGGFDSVFSKFEFRELAEEHDISEKFGDVVYPFGGFTRVIIKDNNGAEYVGKFNFKRDQFIKVKGLVNAIRVALKGTNVLYDFDTYLAKVKECLKKTTEKNAVNKES
jgi:hypothetical protein